jgi:hypothetical protein
MAADKGTIVHKALEILAAIKKGQQDGIKSFTDDIVGQVKISDSPNVDKLVEKVFGFYTGAITHHNWSEADLKFCKKMANRAISLNDGMFNPLNRDIIEPELKFDFEIDKPWAKYKYKTYNGDVVEGNLALKGTIDLVTKLDDTIEIIDWKTGAYSHKDWATGKEKTHDTLHSDPQLRMYHYAVNHVFPECENIIFTIFFIATTGPFSVCFSKDDLPETERMLQEKFETIKKVQKPKLINSENKWKCNKVCYFGKNTFEGTDIKPIQEFRNGQVTPKGQLMTMCEQVKFEIERKGMDRTTSEYSKKGHSISYYHDPGSIK